MKIITPVFLIAALALSPEAKAQQPWYAFRAVAQPGTIIGGRSFTRETIVGNVALNDAAEVAFVASQSGPETTAIFTSRRIVVRQSDVIDGKLIPLLAGDVVLAINNAGQVAYEAWYADSRERALSADASGRGIFVENHFVSEAAFDANGNAAPFIFTDDGRIVFETAHASPAAPSPKNGVPARIRLKLPRDTGVSITPGANRPAQRKPSAVAHPALPPFPTNHRGQIVIPVNLEHEGFLLLLGTPSAH